MPEQQNIIERIHASYYQLAPAEKKVADYVLAQREQIQFMSITQLADECGVADATISRFCRSLQLKGFNAFKLELAQHTAPEKIRVPVTADLDTMEGRCQEISRLAHEAVDQTVQLLQTLPEPPAIMVGGAVVTPDYAAGLNAAYAKDARQAVEIARKVLG